MKTYQYISSEMAVPEVMSLAHGQLAVFSRSSPIKTSGNEDCAAVISVTDETTLLMVADGMGGHINGAAASAFLTRLLEDAILKEEFNDTAVRETILSSIEKTNLKLLRKETGEGTTVAIAEINRNSVRTYHVGDSEILISGQKGKVKLQTLSHSPVAYAQESGLIEEDSAITHEDRHFISNFIGQDEMHITIGSPVLFDKRDTLLLGTDGLFDNLFKHEVIDIIRKGRLDESSKVLADSASARMQSQQNDCPCKPDDLTFILYRHG